MFEIIFFTLGSLVLTGIAYRVEKNEPNSPGRLERTLAGNKYSLSLVILALMAAAFPGIWGAYSVASGTLSIGIVVLVVWAYPYWLLVSYLETRTLLRVRLGFSLGLTAIALAIAVSFGSQA